MLLICDVEPIATFAPVVVNVAANAVMSVPNGTVAVTAVPLIAAATSAPSPGLCADPKPNPVSALSEAAATVRTV